ncbi:MAG: hypothetical protein ACQEXJ_13570 [Myxococcota bacterium]
MPTAGSSGTGRIGIKEAVNRAVEHLEHLYADEAAFVGNVLLEEVEPSHTGDWLVTLGFDRRRRSTRVSEALRQSPTTRAYKVFTVDAETGEVKSMKIREFPGGS